MPLEDLTGAKYINSLNSSWPLGTDLPDAGDDHLRGIKNTLKKSFPLISGPVNRDHTSLSNGSVPTGSRMVFYMAAAPAGWTRFNGIATTYALRVVDPATAGGVGAGRDDPVVNDKVGFHTHPIAEHDSGPSDSIHVHAVNGTTAVGGASHTHTGTTINNGNHSHSFYNLGQIPAGTNQGNVAGSGTVAIQSNIAGAHQHDFTTAASTASHAHTMNFNTSAESGTHGHAIPETVTEYNTDASNWLPRYLDVILCQKS
jgi:hypothetical protein